MAVKKWRPVFDHGFHGLHGFREVLPRTNPCHPCHPWSRPLSVSDQKRAHNAVFDKARKVLRTRVEPTQVLPAIPAVAERPRMPCKPRMFQSRLARLPALQCSRESNNLEPNPFRVGERELIPAVVLKPVAFVGD